MVLALLTSLVIFAFAWAVHLLWWRSRPPRHHMSALSSVFIGTPVLVAVIWVAVGRPAIVSITDLPAVAIFYVGASACYMIAYTAVEETSPSLGIIQALQTAGSAGCSFQELCEVIAQGDFVKRRTDALRRDEMIIAADGGFLLTPRGRLAACAASLIARIFNIQKNA
jgi:hypothetical protein